MATPPEPVLRATGIRRRFGTVQANDGVDLDLRAGEVHAVVGENGAGKSTLMQILYGALRPDSGSIEVGGHQVDLRGPGDAIAAGVGLVHQHLMLIPEFTIAENVTLGAEPGRRGLIDEARVADDLAAPMRRLGIAADAGTRVGRLSPAQQQRVELLKVIVRGARILLLDEPTAILTPQATEELFDLLRELASTGYSVVFISHKLTEVMSLADRVTVLRGGRTCGTWDVDEVDVPTLVSTMTGRSDLALGRQQRVGGPAQDLVEVVGLSGRSGSDSALDAASFSVRAGEILGVASVDGNGERSLVALLTGAARPTAGAVRLGPVELSGLSIAGRRALGVAHVPEDRHADGLPLQGTVAEALAAGRLSRTGLRRSLTRALTREIRSWAGRLVADFAVKTSSVDTRCGTLSGGNQQKLVVARELAGEPSFLVLAQPTRGIDLPAAQAVHAAIHEVVGRGAAALVVSADLDELLRLTDRIIVLYRGRVAATLSSTSTTREQVGAAMMGGRAVAAA